MLKKLWKWLTTEQSTSAEAVAGAAPCSACHKICPKCGSKLKHRTESHGVMVRWHTYYKECPKCGWRDDADDDESATPNDKVSHSRE